MNLTKTGIKRSHMMGRLFVTGLVAVAGSLCSLPAFAALGSYPLSGGDNNVTSSAVSRAVSKASANVASYASVATTPAPYSVNTVTLQSGTVVREFIDTAKNQVFAVAWKGPHLPNLQQVLGTYFSRFSSDGAGVVSVGPTQRGLSSSDLVVQSFGHMGNFTGYAYLPAMVPAGVSISDIQ